MTRGRVLQVRGLSKSFPGVQALTNVDLEVRRGEVHALTGENGAGKSTLVKILSGFFPPDAGEIWLRDTRVQWRSPHEALQQGIAMIHQELLPFGELSVAENIFMGRLPGSRFLGWLDHGALRRGAAGLLERLGVSIAPSRKMKTLGVAEMQTVEIAKALAHRAELVIMDEPTSALSEHEIEALHGVIRELKGRGVAVLYISHKLEEVFGIADRVTVLRDGQWVTTCPIGELDRRRLIALMVGRELDSVLRVPATTRGEVLLSARGLTQPGAFQGVNLELRRGEIVGLAGLMGAGRTALAHALFGLAPAEAGRLLVHGRVAQLRSPRHAMDLGIALVSEDRKGCGLVLKLSVKHNLTLAHLSRCCRRGRILRTEENRLADEQIRAFGIKTPSRERPVAELSGGNQQKVAIAKSLWREPDILILDEPTRGIDIAAKAEVHAIIARFAAQGKAILLISSELPEVMSLSHRILVMRRGVITAELDPKRTTPQEVMRFAMTGHDTTGLEPAPGTRSSPGFTGDDRRCG